MGGGGGGGGGGCKTPPPPPPPPFLGHLSCFLCEGVNSPQRGEETFTKTWPERKTVIKCLILGTSKNYVSLRAESFKFQLNAESKWGKQFFRCFGWTPAKNVVAIRNFTMKHDQKFNFVTVFSKNSFQDCQAALAFFSSIDYFSLQNCMQCLQACLRFPLACVG